MSPGDNLFVPSGGAVSWRAKAGGTEENEAVAVRYCYVDASNFNSVKNQLPLYAAVEVRCSQHVSVYRAQRGHANVTLFLDDVLISSARQLVGLLRPPMSSD